MDNVFEIINGKALPGGKIKAAVFDFDGTISTLRCGWEKVMGPMMLEYLSPGKEPDKALIDEVSRYIDESTGIQTVYQMQWLSEKAEKLTGVFHDAWYYKDEYNRRLMESVEIKKEAIEKGKSDPSEYTIAGAVDFLKELKNKGIALYLASGTDHCDVKLEAELLGVAGFFDEICGAPERKALCSKEAVLKKLFSEKHFSGRELLVIGDGKVEIALGKQYGAFALGAATDEEKRCGVNPVKRNRLIIAGADVITGDFSDTNRILRWMD
ncbi:MAG: HAD family hydrolase [Clostridia bacterium]|nr:HAD family hydrolase [Clostridia bacterium]